MIRGSSDDEIHMKPAVLWGFILLATGGNFLYTTRATDAETAQTFSAKDGQALREQVASLQRQVEMLQTTGPNNVVARLEKVQQTVDGCMECHLKNDTHLKGVHNYPQEK